VSTLQLSAMAAATCAGVFLLVVPLRNIALRTGFVAVPNARSSHRTPVPLGGGLSFVVPVSTSWFTIALLRGDGVLLLTSVLGLGLATLGYVDDRQRVSPALRLWTQALAAGILAGAVLWRARGWDGIDHVALIAAAAVLLTWSANLFNFMDGLDGLAASESLFVTLGGLALAVGTGADAGFALALAALAGGLLGFLPWNAPKARIFMGDAGSTWLGFSLAALAIQDAVRMPGLLSAWMILPALFVADATVCVVRRAVRGENVMAGHRAHAYQNLSRVLGSHGRVVLLFMGCNLCLVPAVWASVALPQWRWVIFVSVYAVAIAAAIAGRSGVHGVADEETRRARRMPPGTGDPA
jgi:Fuc2NAc and GlcNAc transferase